MTRRKTTPVNLTCDVCGAPFQHLAQGQRPKRCSDECRKIHEKRRLADFRARQPVVLGPKPAPAKRVAVLFPCAECAAPIKTLRPGRPVYCPDCRRARRNAQAREFQRAYREEHGAGYGTRYFEARASYASARRARVRGARVGKPFTRKEIFDRDAWRCGFCGEAIDPALKWPDPGSVSLDHIVPLIHGGEHSRENTRAAHLGCNSADGNRWRNYELTA